MPARMDAGSVAPLDTASEMPAQINPATSYPSAAYTGTVDALLPYSWSYFWTKSPPRFDGMLRYVPSAADPAELRNVDDTEPSPDMKLMFRPAALPCFTILAKSAS